MKENSQKEQISSEQKTSKNEKPPIILKSEEEYNKKIKNAKNSINYLKFLIASLTVILIFAIVGMTGVIPGVTLAKSAMLGIFCGVGILSNAYEIAYNKVKIEDLEKGRQEFLKQQRSQQKSRQGSIGQEDGVKLPMPDKLSEEKAHNLIEDGGELISRLGQNISSGSSRQSAPRDWQKTVKSDMGLGSEKLR